MPASKRAKPLYRRGKYALHRREGRSNLEIVWYDDARKRERSISARTADVGQGRLALDRLYLSDSGERVCPHCRRPWEHEASPMLASAIADYLIGMEGRAGFKSAQGRLGHVTDYLAASDAGVQCAAIDSAWVDRFRAWLLARPVVLAGVTRPRSLSHVEGCVMQLAAAINATPGQRAQFRAEQQKNVAASPTYRADAATIAAMFDFCLRPDGRSDKERAMIAATRRNLLAYLRMAVATWARPDAIYDVKPDQWHSAAGVLDLNPRGRRQTKKHRPKIPVARQLAPHLDAMTGPWLPVTTIKASWGAMAKHIGLPTGSREAGEKLIRRSIATIARKRLGEANWIQGQMMLGHVKHSVSDIYALPDPANLGLALAVTEQIIDEIEALAPGAYRTFTAVAPTLAVVNGGKNG